MVSVALAESDHNHYESFNNENKMLRIGRKQTVLDPARVFSFRPKVQPVSKPSPKPLRLNPCKHKSRKRVVRCSCSQASTPCSSLTKHTSQNTRMRVELIRFHSDHQVFKRSRWLREFRRCTRGAQRLPQHPEPCLQHCGGEKLTTG